MERIAWYFRQSVGEADMDFLDNATESAIEKGFSEGEQPFGIVSGYTVAPTAGMNIEVTGTSVAYDRQGRRIAPSVSTITQSIATATDGGSTAVVTAGNERWVSIFARAGRRFTEPATDGNAIAVRKYALEALNALGDTDHPAGAYDGVAAKEAGINLFYVVVGTEDSVGSAARPALIDDGVLVADIRLMNGLSTLTLVNIFLDRRQNLVSSTVSGTAGFRDLYAGLGPLAGSQQVGHGGLSLPPVVQGQSGAMVFRVSNGAGYFYNAGLEPSEKAYRRFNIGTAYVAVQPADGSNPRRDLLVVNADGAVRVVTGTVAPLAVPPTVPPNTVPLAEVMIFPGTTSTLTAPIMRRGFRRLPYPYSTMTGILEGCRIGYDWISGATAGPYIQSIQNKVAFNGEVLEFAGGTAFTAAGDQDAVPGSVGTMVPFYFYVCRNEYHDGTNQSAIVLMSMTVPHPDTGHPIVNLRSPSMRAVPKEDALLIGVGWSHTSNLIMPVVSTDDGWFYPQLPLYQILTTVPTTGTPVIFPSAPVTLFVDQVLLKVVVTPHATAPTNLIICPYSNPDAGANVLRTLAHGPAAGGITVDVGEIKVPAPGGGLYVYSPGGATWGLMPMGYHLSLPRISFGGNPF